MKPLSKLFYECAYEVEYKQAGDSVNYAFVEEGDKLHIYFQGSNSITDWVRNFLFKKKPYKEQDIPFKVHKGFLAAWKEVEDIIGEKINEKILRDPTAEEEKQGYEKVLDYKWKTIVIVGYSHGAALAALCHEYVWFNRPDTRDYNLIGYGFEAPRMYGGFSVKEELKERWETFFVIRTNNDIVTHCPPCIFGYCHVGEVLKLKGNTDLVQNKLPKCVKSHFPQVVYDALINFENNGGSNL